MNFLEERILKDGIVKPGNVLKVDSFLNHQMDISLMEEIGREFRRRFANKPVTKVLTQCSIALPCKPMAACSPDGMPHRCCGNWKMPVLVQWALTA